MWKNYITATTIEETLNALAENGERARIVAGATDLILELERGVRKGIDTLIDVTRIPQLDQITLDEDGMIHLGPLVTHNHCVESRLIRERAYPLARAAWEVGAPQIRNRGTIAGNLITASPANDTITPLMALGAWVELVSVGGGSRRVPLDEFYTGVRKTVMAPDEMLTEIAFQEMTPTQRGTFLKLGLRRAQAISLVDVAVVLDLDRTRIKSAVITLGAVAPTIIHAPEAEAWLAGKDLAEETLQQAGELAATSARPIDDLRGSAAYRQAMVKVLTARALRLLRDGREKMDVPPDPVLLWGEPSPNGRGNHQSKIENLKSSSVYGPGNPIRTSINSKAYTFTSGFGKSLLRLLREEGGLTGTKEGCAEGECGACTVILDGDVVDSCLVLGVEAEGKTIQTIEGMIADLRARVDPARLADAFARSEIEYWASRNSAARMQLAVQDEMGLGWSNHDHLTFRSSRLNFHRLIRLLEVMGFQSRERFYAGDAAGWGAQIMEHPISSMVVFADVDLAPSEDSGDFAHRPLPELDRLGTVGLWVGLHGESFLRAGMHHMAVRVDFERARLSLARSGIESMTPFSDFPFLRQLFTFGET